MPLLPIEKLTFYLPFPDGVLQYVCAECNAHCCRGYGFGGSMLREMGELFTHYPALETSVTSRRGDMVWVQNNGTCPFLQKDLRCRIEATHGKRLKPGVCGLFPFNKMSRLSDDIVVISPHFLCPIRVTLPPGKSTEGSHEVLIKAVKESSMLDSAYFHSNIPMLRVGPKQTPEGALHQEIAFRDKCAAALERESFAAVIGAGASELGRFVQRAALLCGVVYVKPTQRDSVDDILLALAPSWRVELLHLGLDRILRILALAEILIRRISALNEDPLTPQQVHKTYSDFLPAMVLLSLEEAPMTLPKSLQKVPPFGTSKLTFAAFAALRGAEKNLLSGFEAAFTKELSPGDRMAILLELGAHVQSAIQGAPKRR